MKGGGSVPGPPLLIYWDTGFRKKWVVDGINLGVAEDIGRLEFNAAVDAGYTGCGEVDRDPGRYGKSALRKADGGKLVDTDNSTNDFTRDATLTLK